MSANIIGIINSLVVSLVEIPLTIPYLLLLPTIIISILNSEFNQEYVVRDRVYKTSYDYIVVGAGSAGAVMAARLSEISSNNVLLLECGGAENLLTVIPELDLFLQKTPVDWQYQTEPQNNSCFGLKNRQSNWPRGKVMGGSSGINTMVYTRGNPRDYDRWNNSGAQGWSWSDVFPYMIKSEGETDLTYVATGYHSPAGPLTVSTASSPHIISQVFRDSGPFLGYPVGDFNGPVQSVFSLTQRTIRDGSRCSTSRAYLEPIANRPNLDIMKFACVTKILFDNNKKATGVMFDRLLAKNQIISANREVILSAGSINSPQLLMLSGIGHSEHLEALGINVISDLPVGDNLQEHVASGIPFTMNQDIGQNLIEEANPASVLQYFATKSNKVTNNLIEGTGFIKSKFANQSDDWPDCQLFFIPGSINTDFGLWLAYTQGVTTQLYNQVFLNYTGLPTFTIYATVLRPETRGYIRLRSTDPYDKPIIEPNFFNVTRDLDVLTDCLGQGFNLSSNAPLFKQYGSQAFQTKFPGCENLPFYSQSYIQCVIQTYTLTIWHPTCTNKMGDPNDPTTVVDSQGRVKGVSGLRVVDSSIMPYVTTGNTNVPTITIAEKISDNMKGQRLVPFVPPLSALTLQQLTFGLGLPTEPFVEPPVNSN